ncbi:bifunctional methylenetetrahydrofolate dehydrogenase/methenyltetrahydrofolate cyclohydrolase [Lactobacillus sp. PV037]|uniref:bifunctional 5,10-methylenetetrahydrofolate dehydrogenase/5,10-methenyltetrahydrofolate cyclohydrolase n=1 Tax=Lactobacillus sp. PV037 TaxID=2594496 RepID=UPI00223F2E86|nr:tetrahydrofolate dehydrogenase/cyclohydrolase catalytic domain-containing protein [Lactobacillus sp. PV037]QNQ83887.1 bifunctional methylenetetrahydrofolate dehydrogenase/methenyltetrahydrofolate cyclohydrolase [Lactobacillus sp. PV037]
MVTILEGRTLATQIKNKIKKEVIQLKENGVVPTICVIQVGEDPASTIYLRKKKEFAQSVGIKEISLRFSQEITQQELIDKIKELNADAAINAIMVQLPLPQQIDEQAIFETIAPQKDVDGFHPYNQGKLWQGDSQIMPATVRGILSLIDSYELDLVGKNTLIIGRSVIVGKPLASQLLARDATVTIAHSKTQDLSALTKKADIIVSDVGQANLITSKMLKQGVVLLDVGINRVNGRVVGDVAFEDCKVKASAITPVPGGIGPLTVASLMEQVVILTRIQKDDR